MHMADFHQPVLVKETIQLLNCRPGGIYIDGTVGEGGHAFHIFQSCVNIRLLIGMDGDGETLKYAGEKLAAFREKLLLVQGNYSDTKEILAELRIERVDGILLDLGVSTYQLHSAIRGFSFLLDGPLDMRMDRRQSMTASDIVNTFSVRELEKIIGEYGEERWCASVAQSIVRKRKEAPIETTRELAKLVMDAIPFRARPRRIHPATRTFQALRIAVNDELNHLEKGLPGCIEVLAPGGRIAVISFHSLEDRIVKSTFRQFSSACVCPPSTSPCGCHHVRKLVLLTRKPVTPTLEEIYQNPHARSARLRGAERV